MQNSNSNTQTFTLRDLKDHLSKHRISPEKFAEEAQLSHMTIRRWLKRDDADLISEKYYPALAPIFSRQVTYSNHSRLRLGSTA